jgi:uncharacterized delta-60 repeat protein
MNKTLIFWPSLKNFCIAIIAIALTLGSVFTLRVNAQLDPAFGTNGISGFLDSNSRYTLGFFALPDGKFLAVSNRAAFSSNGTGPYDLIRINADGSTDTSYGNGGVVQLPIPFITTFGVVRIYASAMQPDGKIVVVGTDNNDGLILRFNPDGTADTSFSNDGIDRPNVNNNATDAIGTVLIQPDGKIIVSGYTSTTNAPAFFIRYNADGTLDSGFGSQGYSVPGGVLNIPTGLLMQSTGKYVVSGSAGNVLRRINADGSLDSSFIAPNTSSYYLYAIQPDDRILAGTRIDRNESLGRTYDDSLITRLNADGSVDSGFGTGGTLIFNWNRYSSGGVQGITVPPDGRLLFSGYAEIAPNRSKYRDRVGAAALVSPAGVVTGKFLMPGFPEMSPGNHVVVLPNGKFVFSGVLTSFQAAVQWKLYFARINGVPLESYRFKANPFDFVFTMDGIADATVFRPGNMHWYGIGAFPFGSAFPFGTGSDILVPADYVKNFPYKDDFTVEMAYFRPGTGDWHISPDNGNPDNTIVIHWGQNGDIPAPADYDGDAKADLAVFRPSTGDWYIRNSNDNSFTALHWGAIGDKPVPADYDGDGRDDIGVFRPSTGDWYIVKSAGGFLFLHFGANGDIPVQEDYDGDGKADISVWRPSDGTWYRLNSSDDSFYALNWGLSTDIPVPADYDGDFKTDISVFRPSDHTWYIFSSSTTTMVTKFWGLSTDIPVSARH